MDSKQTIYQHAWLFEHISLLNLLPLYVRTSSIVGILLRYEYKTTAKKSDMPTAEATKEPFVVQGMYVRTHVLQWRVEIYWKDG